MHPASRKRAASADLDQAEDGVFARSVNPNNEEDDEEEEKKQISVVRAKQYARKERSKKKARRTSTRPSSTSARAIAAPIDASTYSDDDEKIPDFPVPNAVADEIAADEAAAAAAAAATAAVAEPIPDDEEDLDGEQYWHTCAPPGYRPPSFSGESPLIRMLEEKADAAANPFCFFCEFVVDHGGFGDHYRQLESLMLNARANMSEDVRCKTVRYYYRKYVLPCILPRSEQEKPELERNQSMFYWSLKQIYLHTTEHQTDPLSVMRDVYRGYSAIWNYAMYRGIYLENRRTSQSRMEKDLIAKIMSIGPARITLAKAIRGELASAVSRRRQ